MVLMQEQEIVQCLANKIFVGLFDKYKNMEASIVLEGATEDMISLGFTYAECEDIENLVYAEV